MKSCPYPAIECSKNGTDSSDRADKNYKAESSGVAERCDNQKRKTARGISITAKGRMIRYETGNQFPENTDLELSEGNDEYTIVKKYSVQ